MQMVGSSRRGFSLIELLVVIAIIVILAGILFPVFSVVRAKARRTTCEHNLSQLGHALKLYADDYDGYLPSYSQSHPSWQNGLTDPQKNAPQPGLVITWDMSIQEHLHNTDILHCPDSPFGRDARAFAMTAYCHRHVVLNNQLYFLGARVETIPNRTGVVLLFEKGKNAPGSWGDAMGENVWQSHGSDSQPDYSEKMFHMKGKNFLFLDGHVKWFQGGKGPFANVSGSSVPPPGSTSIKPGQCYYPDRKASGGDWPDPE
jgi:prepilin-type N-terminal cleavage/methylation domain-containing protein/prepilin-type processing-associated H-X9-DG protein